MTVIAAIPARYDSARLPGKPLLEVAGMALIERVYRQVERASDITETIVLTDDERIEAAVAGFGGKVAMTPRELASGTDRVAFAARHWDPEVVLNVQGDEPLVSPDALSRLARYLSEHPSSPVATLAAPARAGDLDDPNVVKVVVASDGRALYFSRAGIPYPRNPECVEPLAHVGVYGYQRAALLEIASIEPSPLERAESLEQLRMLENGYDIQVLRVPEAWPGVDTIEDLRQVAQILAGSGGRSPERPGGGS
ncbi:MAG: 3-deoxy-manno-octulosonate cytidylyltransferase [Thermoanaerobaculia bacterium]